MLAWQGRWDLRLNDLFDRAQRGRTINIPTWFFPVCRGNIALFEKNAKKKRL
jgi:hypothetical protein